ncbi:hypothetical protein [Streptomyces tendae]|uniref:hypothetical protein n=1 Tax=Streptomyces tendae TaxID=1932 RepID=UPI003F4CCCC6
MVHQSEKHGNWRGGSKRLRLWAVDRTRERAVTALVARSDTVKDLNWTVSVRTPPLSPFRVTTDRVTSRTT